MDFSELVYAHGAKVQKLKGQLQTEEATKNALVLPFLQVLGYDVFDPLEVVPEFTADVGTKKGERVDFALMRDGKPIMLIECKTCGNGLDETCCSQLYRYFTTTDVHIGVLTDGVRYRFYTDLEKQNKMDLKPYMEFDFQNVEEQLIPELRKLTKANFNLDDTLSSAGELKYTREIRKLMSAEMQDPSEEFIRLFTGRVYQRKRITQAVMEQFKEIVKRALHQFINETINERLTSVINKVEAEPREAQVPGAGAPEEKKDDEPKIETTAEELEGFYIVKSILREVVDPARITPRDVQSYFSVLLDDNNRKPVCRLYFNGGKKMIGIMGEGKTEERIALERIDDIFAHAEKLRKAAALYDK